MSGKKTDSFRINLVFWNELQGNSEWSSVRFPFTHTTHLLGTAGMQACVKPGSLFQFAAFAQRLVLRPEFTLRMKQNSGQLLGYSQLRTQ